MCDLTLNGLPITLARVDELNRIVTFHRTVIGDWPPHGDRLQITEPVYRVLAELLNRLAEVRVNKVGDLGDVEIDEWCKKLHRARWERYPL
jgi:hypothetical protein